MEVGSLGPIGIMEKKMETTIVYWGYIGIMEKKMENYCSILGLYRDNGKENGNQYRPEKKVSETPPQAPELQGCMSGFVLCYAVEALKKGLHM